MSPIWTTINGKNTDMHMYIELQIREGNEYNSKIIFLISQQKHTL